MNKKCIFDLLDAYTKKTYIPTHTEWKKAWTGSSEEDKLLFCRFVEDSSIFELISGIDIYE